MILALISFLILVSIDSTNLKNKLVWELSLQFEEGIEKNS